MSATLSLPVLGGLVGIPAVAGWLAGRATRPRQARTIGAVGAATTFAATIACAVLMRARTPHGVVDPISVGAGSGTHALFGVDALSAALLPFLALVTLALVIGARRVDGRGSAIRAILHTEAALCAALLARDLVALTVALALAALPTWLELGRGEDGQQRDWQRTYGIFQLASWLPLAAATAVVGVSAPRSLSLDTLASGHLPPATATIVALLVGISIVVRMASVPLSGWLPVLVGRGPLALATLLTLAQPGAYLLVRLLGPLSLAEAHGALRFLDDLGLVTMALGALVALAQSDLRRLLGFLIVSESGALLAGLSHSGPAGAVGALATWIGAGLALTAFSITVGIVEDRTGTTDQARLGGLAGATPLLSGAFLVSGLAAVGLPGTVAFVSEDLLLRGTLEDGLAPAALLLVSMALSGIAVLRAHARVFGGAAPEAGPSPLDAPLGARVAVVSLLLICGAFGLAPGRAVRTLDAAMTIAAEAHAPHAAPP